jgi:hypothetical protein
MECTEKTVLIAQCEAVRLLGVERTTSWRMCRRADLELVHIGRRALVTRASLDRFVGHRFSAAETAAAAALEASSVRWPWVSSVITIQEWPRLRLITCTGTPRFGEHCGRYERSSNKWPMTARATRAPAIVSERILECASVASWPVWMSGETRT